MGSPVSGATRVITDTSLTTNKTVTEVFIGSTSSGSYPMVAATLTKYELVTSAADRVAQSSSSAVLFVTSAWLTTITFLMTSS